MVSLEFPVIGTQPIPNNHGYPLLGALSRLVPAIHLPESPVQVGPIYGTPAGAGLLYLVAGRSRLRLRLAAEEIPLYLPLAGKALDLAGHRVRLGVPEVRALVPAPSLAARLVTIKPYITPESFLEAVRRQLAGRGLHGEPRIPLTRAGPHAGEPRRGILRVKDKRIVGFALVIDGLSDEASLRLQEQGIGGRRRMGCSFLVPLLKREEDHDL